jgi:hypothetical protein
MRKYLLPSLIMVVLGAGLALAQNFNRAIQLSQDTTGAVLVDTAINVYFPGHVLSTTQLNGTPTIAGTGTPTLVGSDGAGLITMGTSGTTATVTFSQTWLAVPSCVVSWQVTLTPLTTPVSYQVATTNLAIQQPAFTGAKINYWCSGQK